MLEKGQRLLYDKERHKYKEKENVRSRKTGDKMLEEFIEENQREAYEGARREERKLKECREMKKTILLEIEDIQKNSDIDFEIFSPRATDKSLKGKMKQLYENLQVLEESILKLEKKAEEYKEKEEKFSVMKKELESLLQKAKQ